MYTGAGTIMPISASGPCTPALPTVCVRERLTSAFPCKTLPQTELPGTFRSMVKAESAESVHSAS